MIETTLRVSGRSYEVALEEIDGRWVATVDGHEFPIKAQPAGGESLVAAGSAVHRIALHDAHTALIDGRPVEFAIETLKGVEGAADPSAGQHGPIRPPMTGRLDSIEVKEGQTVARGDVLFVLEAMKMRNEIKSPADGIIESVAGTVGGAVDTDDVIVVLGPS